MYEVLAYQTKAGVIIYEDWIANLHDNRVEAILATRIDRLRNGNFGDAKALGGGMYELRVNFGPGYRIYYAIVGSRVILLLCAGSKQSQQADIFCGRTVFE